MRKTQKTAVVGGSVVALMAAVVAFAAWTSTGSGEGSATADYTSSDLVVTVGGVSGLYPTGEFDVPFTVTNNNDYDVTLASVTLDSVTVDAAHGTAGCAASSVVSAATGPSGSLVDTDVATKDGTPTASRNFPITMLNSASEACKGAVFTLTLTASGASSS